MEQVAEVFQQRRDFSKVKKKPPSFTRNENE